MLKCLSTVCSVWGCRVWGILWAINQEEEEAVALDLLLASYTNALWIGGTVYQDWFRKRK